MKVGFANREEGKTLVWLDRLRVGKCTQYVGFLMG